MLALLTDENFDSTLLNALLHANPGLDVVRVQDVGLSETDDTVILEWAARERRTILTFDRNTFIGFAWDRIRAGRYMPGVIAVRSYTSQRQIVEEISIIVNCSREGELEGQVLYVPL